MDGGVAAPTNSTQRSIHRLRVQGDARLRSDCQLHSRIAGVQPFSRMLMLTCRLFVAIDVIVGAIKALKDAKKEILGDAKLASLQFRAMAMSWTGAHAAKTMTSELEASQDATVHF